MIGLLWRSRFIEAERDINLLNLLIEHLNKTL